MISVFCLCYLMVQSVAPLGVCMAVKRQQENSTGYMRIHVCVCVHVSFTCVMSSELQFTLCDCHFWLESH